MNYYEKAKAVISGLREKTGYDVRWDLQITYALGKESPHFIVYIRDRHYEVPVATFEFCDVDEIVEDVVKRWKKN